MNADLEDRLIESMHHKVDGIALTGDVLGRATSRHRRRTTMVRAGYGLGVAGLAGVLAAGLTVSNGAAPAPEAAREAPAVQIVPASMKLANAAKASDNISYRLRLNNGAGLKTEGAFDPRTATGYLRTPQEDSVQTELLINGTRYAGGEPLPGGPPPDWHGEKFSRYGQYPGKHKSFLFWSSDAVLVKAGPDPGSLARALKEVDATTSENPDGSLHFEYSTSSKDGSSKASGDVKLNADGRIAKVTLTSTWRSTAKGRVDTGTSTATLELFDYGVKVQVKRPTDVVPAN